MAAPWLLADSYSVWRTHIEHKCGCVCVRLANRNLIFFKLGCEALRREAPAEFSSAGVYTTAMSWGPVLMAWGELAAVVPSKPTLPSPTSTPILYFPPGLSVIFQWDSVYLRSHAERTEEDNGSWKMGFLHSMGLGCWALLGHVCWFSLLPGFPVLCLSKDWSFYILGQLVIEPNCLMLIITWM